MSVDQTTDSSNNSALQRFWQELKRRKVTRVAVVYMVTGWLIIQVAETTFASFGIPEWAFRFVALMVLLGLPVALILAWALELTPDGIKKTKSVETVKHSTDASESLTKKRNWSAHAFGALLPTLIFGSLAMFFYIQAQNSDTRRDGIAARDETAESAQVAQSIAVLPLVNMSSFEENAYFAGGVHEDILTNLSRIDGLQVISRTSMLRYATSDKSLREIGQELGVDYIVEGSVRRIGDHVRVTIQLINAHTDVHLWANNYEREVVDSFATQSAIAREITDSIHLEIKPEWVGDLQGMPTTSVKAYDLYIKAESLEKAEGETEEVVVRRREMLEEAAAEDPDFVEAWAVLKRLYDIQLDRVRRRGWYVDEGDDIEEVAADLRDRSQLALQKAIALDPDNAETLLAEAVDHVWPKTFDEMLEQKAIFDRLINTHPEFAKGWYHLGHWHSHLDDLPEHDLEALEADAIAAFEEALRLDPFNARMVGAVLTWYRDRGYEEDVTRLSERLTEIIPETADDRRLVRVSWLFRQDQIESAFLETADESFIDEFEKGLQEAIDSGDTRSDIIQSFHEMDLAVWKGDRDKLVEMANAPMEITESEYAPIYFSIIRMLGMEILTQRGDEDQARKVAQSVLEQEDVILAQDLSRCGGCFVKALAFAHSVLGDEEEARRFGEQLIEMARSSFGRKRTVRAYAGLDTERAVEIAFGELAKDPNWDGFDDFAAYYILDREFLAHPRVQEYYVNEGKWIDYLAARVPEYAKYVEETAE